MNMAQTLIIIWLGQADIFFFSCTKYCSACYETNSDLHVAFFLLDRQRIIQQILLLDDPKTSEFNWRLPEKCLSLDCVLFYFLFMHLSVYFLQGRICWVFFFQGGKPQSRRAKHNCFIKKFACLLIYLLIGFACHF